MLMETKYVAYHGRIEAKILPDGNMITSRKELFQESLEVFK